MPASANATEAAVIAAPSEPGIHGAMHKSRTTWVHNVWDAPPSSSITITNTSTALFGYFFNRTVDDKTWPSSNDISRSSACCSPSMHVTLKHSQPSRRAVPTTTHTWPRSRRAPRAENGANVTSKFRMHWSLNCVDAREYGRGP